ncbi:MAG TPA: hypothetical protein VFV52_11880 [Bacilli bacterium]|nr:hypothetical protein [Bacilli bacterium]
MKRMAMIGVLVVAVFSVVVASADVKNNAETSPPDPKLVAGQG